MVDFVVELRKGQTIPQIHADIDRLDASLRPLILARAYMFVYGVNVAVSSARVPDEFMAQFVAQEDASCRPTDKKAEARQFLVAAQPFLATPIKYSPAETVAMMARGERPVAPRAPASGAPPWRYRFRYWGRFWCS